MPGIDDVDRGPAVPGPVRRTRKRRLRLPPFRVVVLSRAGRRRSGARRPGQEPRHLADRLDRRGQPYPLRLRATRLDDQIVEPRQAECQVGAALVVDEGVDLVHDHRLGRRQHPPAALRRQQDEQRLRRGHDDVRRAADHLLAIPGGGIAGPDRGADLRVRLPAGRGQGRDLAERRLQVPVDVGAQRLERGHVDDRRAVFESIVRRKRYETVEAAQERRQRLAGAGRRGDEDVAARPNPRPRIELRRGRGGEPLLEPRGGEGMEA